MTTKWSTFTDGVAQRATDQVVGLRSGANVRFPATCMVARLEVSDVALPSNDLLNLEFAISYDPLTTISGNDTFTAPADGWYTFLLGGGSRVNANGTIWSDGDKLTLVTFVNNGAGEYMAWNAVVGASTVTNSHLPLVGSATRELNTGDAVVFELENFGAARAYIGGTLTITRVA